MPRVRVQLNSAGMAALLRDPGVQEDLEQRADAVLSVAQGLAPRDSGDYEDSLHTEVVTTDRVTVRVVAGTDHALLVEAATGNLARSLDAAGGA
jgi:hypothetical protein